MAEYSEALVSCVRGYLDAQEWNYQFDAEHGAFVLDMGLSDTRLQSVRMLIFVHMQDFQVYARPPFNADAKNMGRVMEFLTRANCGLRHGNFELDLRDGDINFKTSHRCGDDLPLMKVVSFQAEIPILMWKRYGDGLLAMLFGDASPADEIAKIEIPRPPPPGGDGDRGEGGNGESGREERN